MIESSASGDVHDKSYAVASAARVTPLPLREGLGEGGRLWRQLRNF
jgi:hypothetical protein